MLSISDNWYSVMYFYPVIFHNAANYTALCEMEGLFPIGITTAKQL